MSGEGTDHVFMALYRIEKIRMPDHNSTKKKRCGASVLDSNYS